MLLFTKVNYTHYNKENDQYNVFNVELNKHTSTGITVKSSSVFLVKCTCVHVCSEMLVWEHLFSFYILNVNIVILNAFLSFPLGEAFDLDCGQSTSTYILLYPIALFVATLGTSISFKKVIAININSNIAAGGI